MWIIRKFVCSFLVIFVLVLASCNTSIHRKAEKQLRHTFSSQHTNGEVLITDVDTIYTEDSLCVLQFNIKAKDWYGKDIEGRCEYIYKINDDGSEIEAVYDFSELNPIMIEIVETAKEEFYVGMNDELKRKLLFSEARKRLVTRGHLIKEDDTHYIPF